MGLRDLVYRLYEHRLELSLSPEAIPLHVGVMCDGNRRWARSAGFRDVSSGHRRPGGPAAPARPGPVPAAGVSPRW